MSVRDAVTRRARFLSASLRRSLCRASSASGTAAVTPVSSPAIGMAQYVRPPPQINPPFASAAPFGGPSPITGIGFRALRGEGASGAADAFSRAPPLVDVALRVAERREEPEERGDADVQDSDHAVDECDVPG